ncbi:hypothetical protein PLICRDRAFT_98675 [Plicaturopsis crispa FD-325 SS-3]|nr:hypothetical protein PLICRDRAFT_98675 [Plicaturopsis crispa FD-325 SS-3]
MDMEYRYWSFMESHPAHVALPANARAEALDVLTWSWTDRLLPSDRPISPPFSQEECGELMGLLRSFSGSSFDSSINTVVHTRAVARILMRIGQWRQAYFRPQKPLPRDAVKDGLRYSGRRIPFSRAAFDFVVSVVCLGIPYIFMNRSHFHRVDEEGGLQSAGPMLVVGACACLIAAIVLSASVTFISLPGLDSVARVAGFVAILTSTASMVSALIVLFRYKADAQQSARSFVGEGMVLISRRSVVLSLPLVFLAYAIIAFVAGVIIYSFNGVTVTNVGTITRHFDQHTRWFVMGTIGGLAGVLITAALLSRR